MDKIDLKKKYKTLYSPSAKEFVLVEVPTLQYLMIDGHGDPSTSTRLIEATQTLFGLSYTLKFHVKKALGVDYTVMGSEGLWWMPDMTQFSVALKSDWDWTLMILQPELITPALVEEAKSLAATKGKAPLAAETRLESFNEGLAVQILYFGAYTDEAPVIARMHEWIISQGLTRTGKHHEIYLSDPRKVAPEKNRTILRQPVKKV